MMKIAVKHIWIYDLYSKDLHFLDNAPLNFSKYRASGQKQQKKSDQRPS